MLGKVPENTGNNFALQKVRKPPRSIQHVYSHLQLYRESPLKFLQGFVWNLNKPIEGQK